MDITPELLRQAMGCRRERAELFGRALDDACDAYGLASPRVLAAFLAQLGHESGSLEHVREVWGPTDAQRRYERDFTAPWPEGETQAWQSAFTRNRLAWRLGNTEAGDAVYEPFSGSGTTIIAAEMTGRACHAIELSPQYVDVAVRRWQQFTGQKAMLEATGEAFPG